MHKKKYTFFVMMLFFCHFLSVAQKSKTDSLKFLLEHAKDDFKGTRVQEARLEAKYKKEQADLLHRKEIELQESKEKTTRIISFIIVLSLLIVAIGFYMRYRSKQISNRELSIKNKEIETAYKIIEEKNTSLAATFRNIETVSKIGQKITATLDLGEVIETLHGHLNNVMEASGMIIYIYDPLLNSLEMKYTIGKHKDVVSHSIPIDSTDSFCVYSFNNKKEIFINDVSKEYSAYLSGYYWSSVPDSDIIQAFINIPLIVGDKAIGVISVQSFKTNVYTREHLEILKSLASFMSAALNNADAYSQLNSARDILFAQKRTIEEKNHDITESINYAKRIQQAILADKEDIYRELRQSFILYKPKDIVSGDFYFFSKRSERIFLAVADCTGHGVPGAFMSMVGSEKLNDAVKQTQSTGEILALINKGIKVSLHQSGDERSTKDGMEIALCAIDLNESKMTYSGAKRPLWIVRNNTLTIEEVKPTKAEIGGFTDDEQVYEINEIELRKGDTFYIFSDGYADQFGGTEGKKIMTKKLKEVLLSIQDKTMQEQEIYLDKFVDDWRSGREQVDDILVIGVRL